MPKGNATFMAQWVKVENGRLAILRVSLMPTGYTIKNVVKALEFLKKGETVYLDPIDGLFKELQNLWQEQQSQSKSIPLSPAPSEGGRESAEDLPKQDGPGQRKT